MAASPKTLPQRVHNILPPADTGVRRSTVLAKDQPAAGIQDPGHLPERRLRVGYRAEGIRHDDRIDGAILERYLVCRGRKKLDVERDRAGGSLGKPQHLGRRIESPALLHSLSIVVRKVQA